LDGPCEISVSEFAIVTGGAAVVRKSRVETRWGFIEFESLVPRKPPVPVMDQGKPKSPTVLMATDHPPEEKADGLNTCVERWQGWQGYKNGSMVRGQKVKSGHSPVTCLV
jgi:hypothetical protein